MSHGISRRDLLVTGLTAVGGTVTSGVLSAAETDKGAVRGGELTLDSLGKLLAALGLKKISKTESRYDFAFTAKHGEEWDLSMSVVLSTDEKTLWLMAWLDELPQSAADVPRTALLKLLADNDKIGNGQFFAYVSSNRRFVLQRVIRNEHISTASFKADLLELSTTVVNTYPHWAIANWKQPGSAGGNSARDSKELEQEANGTDEKSTSSRPSAPATSRIAAKKEPGTTSKGTIRK